MTAQPITASEVTDLDAVNGDMLWPTWQALTKVFTFGRMMRHLSRSKSGWGIYTVDVVSTLKDMPMSVEGQSILADRTDEELLRLKALADLNSRRNDAIWKMAALIYVSMPLSLFLALNQFFPAFVKAYLATGGVIGIPLLIIGLGASLAVYYTNNWRARQIEALIELTLIERGNLSFTAGSAS